METKQTAVEWLDRWFRDNPEATHEEGNKALEQAKAMEKQQIIEAYDSGGDHYTDFGKPIWGIDYYNETYVNSKTPPGAHCEEA